MNDSSFSFSLVLQSPTLSLADCDTLSEAGCDDGTIVTREGVTYIVFDRRAESLEAAIRSATRDVRAAGFRVVRVEMDVLV